MLNLSLGQHSPYLETHTWPEVEWLLKPGTRVSLNARKIRGCYLPLQVKYFFVRINVLPSYQATAVWLSQEVPPARQYKSSELVAQLSLRLHDFILHQTGDPRYQADPLLGLKDSLQPGEVVEYFSPEMGLLRLDTGSTVLFHLNQVRIYLYLYF